MWCRAVFFPLFGENNDHLTILTLPPPSPPPRLAPPTSTPEQSLNTQHCLRHRYSEGLPGKRYYGGNEQIDRMETLCQDRALSLFGLDPEEWAVSTRHITPQMVQIQGVEHVAMRMLLQDVVWCVVWCGVLCCGMFRCGMVPIDITRFAKDNRGGSALQHVAAARVTRRVARVAPVLFQSTRERWHPFLFVCYHHGVVVKIAGKTHPRNEFNLFL